MAQTVKNLPSMQETRLQSLGWEDPLENEMATHSSILAWSISMDRGTGWAIDITSTWILKHDMEELIYKVETDSQHGEHSCGCQMGGDCGKAVLGCLLFKRESERKG